MTASKGIRVRRGTRQRWVTEQQGKHICACGCGEAIEIRTEHFNIGIPRFVHGHNARIDPPKPRKELPPARPCACGCGEMARPGKRYLYTHQRRGKKHSAETRRKMSEAQSGARNPHFGKRPHNWKGGRTQDRYGYIWQQAPGHPNRSPNGYVREHRLVAEEALRQNDPDSEFLIDGFLAPGTDVHHINGVKDDNRAENLEVMWKGDHTRLHIADLMRARWPKAS